MGCKYGRKRCHGAACLRYRTTSAERKLEQIQTYRAWKWLCVRCFTALVTEDMTAWPTELELFGLNPPPP